MNITIIDDNKFDIYVNNLYINFNSDSNDNNNELYDNLKKILINVRKKYALNIFGFYEVDIFYVENYATILKFVKKDEDSIMYKNVDLKIIEHDSDNVYFKFEDFLLNKYFKKIRFYNGYYYANINDIKCKNFNLFLEYCDIVIDTFNEISSVSLIKF